MRILVIRLKHIGDCLLASAVCTNLKHIYPDASVDFAVYEHIAPLFTGHPDIDRVVSITRAEQRSKLLYLRKLFALRRRRYDMVLDLRTDSITVLMTRFTGAERQIGFDRGKWRSCLYKTRVPYPEIGGSQNAKLSILKGLLSSTPTSEFRIYLSAGEVAAMRKLMRDRGIDFDRPIFAFSTVSRENRKSWPVDYFVELIDDVLDRYAAQGILIWGPDERELVLAVASRLSEKRDVWYDIETDDVRRLAALLANTSVFVGNDSGPRHIAEAVGKPTFTIFSPLIDKHSWVPHLGPLHRAVDLQDAIGENELRQVEKKEIATHRDTFYRRITPDLVRAHLIPMLDELFRRSAYDGNGEASSHNRGLIE